MGNTHLELVLALGRALGETMAVTFIIGNSFRISSSVFAPGTTISAAIASEFAESDGLHQSGLILLGLLLFLRQARRVIGELRMQDLHLIVRLLQRKGHVLLLRCPLCFIACARVS